VHRRLSSLLAVAALAVALVGCSESVSVGGDSVSKEDVAKKGQEEFDKIGQQRGAVPPKITCPDDLDAKVGATVRCTGTFDNGSSLGITVTAKSVQDGDVDMTFQADKQVTPPPK
jgi:hypothetical protein